MNTHNKWVVRLFFSTIGKSIRKSTWFHNWINSSIPCSSKFTKKILINLFRKLWKNLTIKDWNLSLCKSHVTLKPNSAPEKEAKEEKWRRTYGNALIGCWWNWSIKKKSIFMPYVKPLMCVCQEFSNFFRMSYFFLTN